MLQKKRISIKILLKLKKENLITIDTKLGIIGKSNLIKLNLNNILIILEKSKLEKILKNNKNINRGALFKIIYKDS
jgi:hypothetical protein